MSQMGRVGITGAPAPLGLGFWGAGRRVAGSIASVGLAAGPPTPGVAAAAAGFQPTVSSVAGASSCHSGLSWVRHTHSPPSVSGRGCCLHSPPRVGEVRVSSPSGRTGDHASLLFLKQGQQPPGSALLVISPSTS